MSIKRVRGSNLNRPARRFKIMTGEPSTIGPDTSISENLGKEMEAKDSDGQQGHLVAASQQAQEQITYV
jgi:hypothetical protein